MARPLFLSRSAAKRVHASALRVLEKTGIILDHPEADRERRIQELLAEARP